MIRYLIILFLLLPRVVAAQQYPQDYFRPPLDIPLSLSGSFGELRNNHFHGGLDLKTGNIEGHVVYAVANGYVSRIKISPVGYGKALYITHPNGYVSVYAHLKEFSKEIEKYVKSEQLKAESFEIELYPDTALLSVNKGEIIAFSGNTGSSGGPHLHFEIRDAVTEHAINPLLFGYKIKDETPPVLSELVIYPLSSGSLVNNSNEPKKIKLAGSNGQYRFTRPTALHIKGDIGFAVHAYDFMDNPAHRNGVYSAEVKVNDEVIYTHQFNRVPFEETRSLNSMIDYEEYKKRHIFYQRFFIEPGNKLSVYKNVKNNGIVSFNDTSTHEVAIILRDIEGNSSVLNFKINGAPAVASADNSVACTQFLKYNQPNVFKNEHLIAEFPAHIFYDDLPFVYEITDTLKGALTATHHLHNEFMPVHDFYSLTFNIGSIPENLRSKTLIVNRDNKGRITPLNGEVKGDLIAVKAKTLGSFTIMRDTTPPVITPLNIPASGNMSTTGTIRIKIADNLSGISSYKAYLDEKFIIMEYDAKTATLTHSFEPDAKGRQEFLLEVQDNRGNKKEYRKLIHR